MKQKASRVPVYNTGCLIREGFSGLEVVGFVGIFIFEFGIYISYHISSHSILIYSLKFWYELQSCLGLCSRNGCIVSNPLKHSYIQLWTCIIIYLVRRVRSRLLNVFYGDSMSFYLPHRWFFINDFLQVSSTAHVFFVSHNSNIAMRFYVWLISDD